jgi:hypothetical protein
MLGLRSRHQPGGIRRARLLRENSLQGHRAAPYLEKSLNRSSQEHFFFTYCHSIDIHSGIFLEKKHSAERDDDGSGGDEQAAD